ncbi:MAG: putative DNA binding domain-containing protein [Muribaculaceae bacterium]|nr:putative DNA binding domain-containing protein [Muribaculaceae bacterium]
MNIDIDFIRLIVSKSEGVDTEFKETTGQLNRGMEALCGMMNGRGGMVLFGVDNKGKIIGQEISDKTTREIGDALRRFDPAVEIQPQYLHLEGSDKYLIAFYSNGMDSDKPYMWDGKPFQRHDSVTTIMPRERFLRLHEEQTGLTYKWEHKINPYLSMESLDEDLIRKIVDGGIRRGRMSEDAKNDTIPTILRRLKLIYNGEIRNSAAVLFGKDLTEYPQMLVRLARFNGVDKKEFIDNKQIIGNNVSSG